MALSQTKVTTFETAIVLMRTAAVK